MASRSNSHSDGAKADRIERLKKRVDEMKRKGDIDAMPGIILGVLDLLADEL